MNAKENRKRWKRFINNQSESNKTIVQYCEDNDLNVHQFHYYKRQFKLIMVKEKEIDSSNFVEVVQPEVIIDDQISLCLNGINVSVDQKNFTKLLRTVKQLD